MAKCEKWTIDGLRCQRRVKTPGDPCGMVHHDPSRVVSQDVHRTATQRFWNQADPLVAGGNGSLAPAVVTVAGAAVAAGIVGGPGAGAAAAKAAAATTAADGWAARLRTRKTTRQERKDRKYATKLMAVAPGNEDLRSPWLKLANQARMWSAGLDRRLAARVGRPPTSPGEWETKRQEHKEQKRQHEAGEALSDLALSGNVGEDALAVIAAYKNIPGNHDHIILSAIVDRHGPAYAWARRLVAARPDLDDELLVRLALDEDRGIRTAVMNRDILGSEFLRRVVDATSDQPDKTSEVREGAARHPETPPDVLALLAGDKSRAIRLLLVQNANTPFETIKALHDADPALVDDSLAGMSWSDNPNCAPFSADARRWIHAAGSDDVDPDALALLAAGDLPFLDRVQKQLVASAAIANQRALPETLTVLAADGDRRVRLGVAGNPNTPAGTLARLAADEDEWVRRAVLDNPNASVEARARAVPAADRAQRLFLAENSGTRPEFLAALAADEDRMIRLGVAANPGTSPETLTVLAADGDREVRRGVADNPNTPAGTLTRLAADEDEWVRLAVLDNPNASVEARALAVPAVGRAQRLSVAENSGTRPELLAALAADEDRWVRLRVAANPGTSPGALATLAADGDREVRRHAIENPNTPPETLARLAADEDREVRLGVAGNPNTPAETLARLAADEDRWVRQWVAGNTNTSAETLTRLAADSERDVRCRVVENPNTPPEILTRLAADEDHMVRQAAVVAGTP